MTETTDNNDENEEWESVDEAVDDILDDTEESTETDDGPSDSKIGATIASIPKVIPKWTSIFRSMAIKSIENYHKRAGGDAIAIDAKAGQQLDFTPVKYRTAEECEDGERPGWVEKSGDKVWEAGSEGRVVDRLGKTPVVALDRDSHVECGWLRPRIGEAIELDRYGPLYSGNDFSVEIDATPGGQAPGTAMADGGMAGAELKLDSIGEWAGDAVVDLDSRDGYDGMRVSFRKATEWQAETATSEEMQLQEERGYQIGLQNGDGGPSVVKLLLVCAAIILGTLAIVFLLPEFLGGEDGSSMNPLLSTFGALWGI